MSRPVERVLVVGAGLGGLTLAVALLRLGLEVTVFEQAPELREVGAGLTLWCNAVRVLDRLGLKEPLRRAGRAFRTVERTTSTGRLVSRMDVARLSADLEGENLFLHRARLQAVLQGALPADRLVTGARCDAFEEVGDEVQLRLAGGRTVRGDLLVGADGLRSAIRARLWNDGPPRYSGETCWRAVLSLPDFPRDHLLRQIFGPGRSAGICALDDERVYYRLDARVPEGGKDSPAMVRDELLRLYRGWPHGLPELIARTPPEAFLRSDVHDRAPLERWSRGRVTLLGDAAHPTVPNLGQGACMAIEDAMVLARALASEREAAPALAAYERERVRRTGDLVRRSHRIGLVDRWTNPVGIALRDTVLRALSGSVGARLLREQLAYDAGRLPAHPLSAAA